MESVEKKFDDYGSHLYVFEKIFACYEVENVLEFGMGSYSTKCFTEHAKFVFSVEQESIEWYKKIVSEIKSPNWNYTFQFIPRLIFEYFDKKGIKFDLVFSDGASATRCMVANLALKRNVPLVVLHDAEKVRYYGWNHLNIPKGYNRFDFQCKSGSKKVTTLITNYEAFLIDKWDIPEHERIVIIDEKPSHPAEQFAYPENITAEPVSGKTIIESK